MSFRSHPLPDRTPRHGHACERRVCSAQDVLDNPRYEVLRRIVEDNTYNFWWSCLVLAAEIGGFILVHLSQQMFCRQDTKFFEMSPERVAQLREVSPPPPQPHSLICCSCLGARRPCVCVPRRLPLHAQHLAAMLSTCSLGGWICVIAACNAPPRCLMLGWSDVRAGEGGWGLSWEFGQTLHHTPWPSRTHAWLPATAASCPGCSPAVDGACMHLYVRFMLDPRTALPTSMPATASSLEQGATAARTVFAVSTARRPTPAAPLFA